MKKSAFKFFRNTFRQGIRDTFDILMGNHDILESMDGNTPTYSFGVLDLLIVPYISLAMFNYGFPIKSISAEKVAADETKTGVFRRAIGVIGLALEVTKGLVALTLTAVLSPVVLAIHIIKYPFSKYFENKFYALKGEQQVFTGTSTIKITHSLGEVVRANNLTLNDLEVSATGAGTHIAINTPYTGMSSIYDGRSNINFFSPGLSAVNEHEALFAGKALGFNTF